MLLHPLPALATLILTGAAPLPAPAPAHPVAAQADGEEVRLHFWSPERGDLEELFDWAYNGFVRQVRIATPDGETHGAENVFLMGDSIVVYDTPAYAARVLAALNELDRAWNAPEEGWVLPRYETLEYSPRFLPIDATLRALEQYEHTIYVDDGAGGYSETSNVRLLRERGLLLVVDLPEQLARIRGLLQRIDVPQPQVLLTCYLARGTASPADGLPLPEELTRNLGRLVPYAEFDALAMGLLRTAATPGESISIALPTGMPGGEYALEARTGAYDVESGTLTLDDCRFVSRNGPERTIFRTVTAVRRDEYTVLGASGSAPLFVVLFVASLER